MYELTLVLNSKNNIPLYEQIYQYIKNEIKNGKIECKSKLPSTRSLAEHLQVSRSTVDMAYTQLISEGYIEAIPCKGYYVCEISLLYDLPHKEAKVVHKQVQVNNNNYIDFSPRGIDVEHFPFNIWRKITKNILTDENKIMFESGSSMGDMSLRKAICRYLFEARNVHCSPEQILIGAGNDYLLMLLCHIFGNKRVIAMESPTYQQAYRVLKTNDQTIVTVEVEKDGINVDEIRSKKANTVYIMPSHHYPLGTVMSIGKRLEILKWANESEDNYIIEDDYDSEFRYHGKTIPALKGIQSEDNIIYIGTFSKSITPAIRMSYMVLPDRLVERYKNSLAYASQTVSRFSQAVVTEFINDGYFERHLNRMRSIYRAKHDLLISKLREFGNDIRISGENAGLHLLVSVNNTMSEDRLIEEALKKGVKVYGLSEYYIEGTQKNIKAIILGFANLSEKQIVKGTELLGEAWFSNKNGGI